MRGPLPESYHPIGVSPMEQYERRDQPLERHRERSKTRCGRVPCWFLSLGAAVGLGR